MAPEFKEIEETFTKAFSEGEIDPVVLDFEPLKSYLQSHMAKKRAGTGQLSHEEHTWIQKNLLENAKRILTGICVYRAQCTYEIDSIMSYPKHTREQIITLQQVDENNTVWSRVEEEIQAIHHAASHLAILDFSVLREHVSQLCDRENTWTHTAFDLRTREILQFVRSLPLDPQVAIAPEMLQWLRDFYLIHGPYLQDQCISQMHMVIMRLEEDPAPSPQINVHKQARYMWKNHSDRLCAAIEVSKKVLATHASIS